MSAILPNEAAIKQGACDPAVEDSKGEADGNYNSGGEPVDLNDAPASPLSDDTPVGNDDARHWALQYSGSMSSRYPSTMKSWSRSSRDDILRTSWNQLTGLNVPLSSSLT